MFVEDRSCYLWTGFERSGLGWRKRNEFRSTDFEGDLERQKRLESKAVNGRRAQRRDAGFEGLGFIWSIASYGKELPEFLSVQGEALDSLSEQLLNVLPQTLAASWLLHAEDAIGLSGFLARVSGIAATQEFVPIEESDLLTVRTRASFQGL